MRLILLALFLVSSLPVLALPGMTTKEKVRLELWYAGVSAPILKKEVPTKEQSRPLPIELEQALSKF